MRRFLTIVLLLQLAAVPVADARSKHRHRVPCKPGHAHMLASDTVAQVYFQGSYEEEGGWFRPERIVGCVYGRPHISVVGYATGGSGGTASGSEVRQLVGSKVVVESSGGSIIYGSESNELAVTDLRTGKVLHTPTGPPEPASDAHPDGYNAIVGAGRAVSVVLKPDGAFAWIASPPAFRITPLGAYQVYAYDASGKRMLAAGSDIEPHSLALGGSTIYWMQAGRPGSAELD